MPRNFRFLYVGSSLVVLACLLTACGGAKKTPQSQGGANTANNMMNRANTQTQQQVSPQAAAAFTTALGNAKNLLSQTPTGTQVVQDLSNLISQNVVKEIDPTTQQTKPGHLGGLSQSNDGSGLSILIKQNLSATDLAQALAHEVSHVKSTIGEVQYFAQNPDLQNMMKGVVQAVQSNSIQAYATGGHQKDVDFFVASKLFQEVKAYQVNLQLDQEGIPFSDVNLKTAGPFNYALANNAVPGGQTALTADNATRLSNLISQYSNLVDFQTAFLQNYNAQTTTPAVVPVTTTPAATNQQQTVPVAVIPPQAYNKPADVKLPTIPASSDKSGADDDSNG